MGRRQRKKKRKKTREIGRWKERERRSREYLMESGGVYRSARQRRLFHLVIQLFSHLVDVVSPCEGSGRTLRHPMQSDRITLKNSKVMILWVSDRAIQSCRLENGWLQQVQMCLQTLVPKSLQFRGCHSFSSSYIFHFVSHFLAPRIQITDEQVCLCSELKFKKIPQSICD